MELEKLNEFTTTLENLSKKLVDLDLWYAIENHGLSEPICEVIELDIKSKYEEFEKLKSLALDCQKELEKVREQQMADLDKKKKALDEEQKRLKKVTNIEGGVITLNVGGHLYTTLRSTICADKDSMLYAMFSGNHSVFMLDNNSYFIDADGKHFRYILNYLRGKITDPSHLPANNETLNELKVEADYFQIRGLKQLIDDIIKKGPKLTQDYVQKFFIFDKYYHPINNISFSGLNLDKLSFANIRFNFAVSFVGASLVGASFRNSVFSARGLDSDIFTQTDFTSADLRECDFRETTLNIDNAAVIFNHSVNIEEAYFDESVLDVIKQNFEFE